jgi:hypothetical protein
MMRIYEEIVRILEVKLRANIWKVLPCIFKQTA